MSTVTSFSLGNLMVYPLASSKDSESQLEIDQMPTISARLDPVSSASSPSLVDDFLGFLAL